MKSNHPPVKKLKLSFAMGGGVSLGAFSGAALTEALKLLLIGGLDDEGRRYTHIELDSMSGASAGAVSLCIMLSSLLNYKRYITTEVKKHNHKFLIEDIDAELREQFGPDWKAEHQQYIEPLRALQVAQKLQEVLWVEKVNMDELIRIKDFNPEQKDNFSLLDRSLLIELVNDYILADIENINDGEAYIISDNRFLFACSLTNLIPLALGHGDNQDDFTEPLVKELQKAHASYNHKELRLFDFQLNKHVNEEKSRLTKAVTIGRNETFQFQLHEAETWSVIAATCLACAAFPFAFEPVVLKRYKYEYKIAELDPEPDESNEIVFEADFETHHFKDKIPTFQSSYTTKYNRQIEQSVPWTTRIKPDETDSPAEGDEFFHFSYIDGGTLNNEPIREAFRMANYLDVRDSTPSFAYDRIVIFVDPIVRTEQIKHNSPSFYKYNVKHKHNRLYVRKNGEWNRLTSFTSKLIATLRDQGAIKEEHKISTYMSSINLNKKLGALIRSSPFNGDFSEDFTETVLEFLRFQSQQNNDDHVSTFDVNDRLFIENILKRYLVGRGKINLFKDIFVSFYEIIATIRNYQEDGISIADITVELNQTIPPALKSEIKKFFYQNILQAILDADGKDPSAMRMAITPVRYNVEKTDDIKQPRTIELPGAEFEAFGGFASESARAFSNEYGRYCAYQALSRGDFRKYFSRIVNREDLPYNARLIDRNTAMEERYRSRLIKKSPMTSLEKAASYWKDVRKKIYRLLKLRTNKSLRPLLTLNSTLSATAILIIIIFAPWYVQRFVPFSAAFIQFPLFGVFFGGILWLIARSQRASLKEAFYYYKLPCLKLALTNDNNSKIKISHARFNGKGKLMKLHLDGNRQLLPIPYFIGQPEFSTSDDETAVHFTTSSRIPKKFARVFSLLEQDIQHTDLLETITLYHKAFPFLPAKFMTSISISELKAIRELEQVEKFISPMIHGKLKDSGVSELKIKEEIVALEDQILDFHTSKLIE